MEVNRKMNGFMKVVTNKWFRMVVSLLGVAYSVVLAYFDYIVFFYDIEYSNRQDFAKYGTIFSLIICLLFFYTRRSPFTCLFGMVNMVLFFPLLLLDWGNWPLLLPGIVVTLFGFFCCHMNETAKTILGTIFLLMYILGGIVFFMVMNVLRPTTTDTLIEKGVSPSGAFRYYVLDVQNKSDGKMQVYVQPNTLDVDAKFLKLDTTIKKLVRQANKPIEFDCEWSGSKLIIDGEVYFDEMDSLSEIDGQVVYDIADAGWSYTYFSIDYPIFNTIESVKDMITGFISSTEGDGTSDESSSDTEESTPTEEDTEETSYDEGTYEEETSPVQTAE